LVWYFFIIDYVLIILCAVVDMCHYVILDIELTMAWKATIL